MADVDKMQSPLRDKNELVATVKEEISTPKTNQKRKSSETSPIKRKKVLFKSEVETETSSSKFPEPCCSADTVENVLEDMEEEIDNALEQPCYKNKLTPTNVKSILRHIIANEYVLTMVRDTMKPSEKGELGDIAFEPKLTRSKAKEMRKQQCSLPWPVASPAKTVQKVSKKLLEEEFPDESSGDEDYKPEEECSVSTPVSRTTDMSEDENALVIALPPELDISFDASEADKIALRTRSKLCLNDTPLEEIEASFIAPDITMDMYDTQCDDKDWQSFLSELMKPIDSTGTNDHPDDAENDPEYKAIEDEIPDYEDLRYEQITPDEWNELMLGNYELAKEDLSFLDDEDEEEEARVEVEFPENAPPLIWMTSDERLQLDEQLRMYVQLLTQSHLLTHGNPVLKSLNELTKILLEEMKMFATRERASTERSAFYAQNLDGALDIVKKFEDVKLPSEQINTKLTNQIPVVPPHIHQTLASSKVFIYPELLPKRGFRNTTELGRTFNTPEDNLIALGLEQFEGLGNSVECIHRYLMPMKSVGRIITRIKYCHTKFKPLHNSIKFYRKFKQAPKFQRVIRIFDPNNIKSPKDYAPEFLPEWMKSYSKFSTSNPGNVSAPSKTPSTKAPLILPKFRKPLRPRKYVRLLPCGLYIPPPPPIFKKKSTKKRTRAPSICDSESPYIPPPLRPKPRPSNYNSSESNTASSDSKRITKCDSEDQDNVSTSPLSDSDSPYQPPTEKPRFRLSNSSSSESSISCSYNKKSKKGSVNVQGNVFAASFSDSESLYEPPTLKPRPRLSNSSICESSTKSSGRKKTIKKCSSEDQDNMVTPYISDSESPYEPSPMKSKASLSDAVRQAVWAALSGPETSAATKSSKWKTAATDSDEVDDGSCVDDDEESEASVIKTASKLKKRRPAKKEMESSARVKSSTKKTVTTKVCDEVDESTCDYEEESADSVVRDVSKMKKKKSAKKKTFFTGARTRKKKVSDDVKDSISDTEKESETSVSKGVFSQGKRQGPKTKTESSVDGTDSDEVDERSCDTEEELTTSAVRTTSRMGLGSKKRNQSHRDFETSLALLQPVVEKEEPMKEEQEAMFANSYLLRATEILKDDSEVYEKFLATLCKYHQSAGSPVELYSELQDVLSDYPALARDFVVFLRPEQAKECGRYKEHIALSKVREFFKKIEIHFKDQPERISRILRRFAQLREQVDLTSSEVISALRPFLKNQPHLFKELNDILSLPK